MTRLAAVLLVLLAMLGVLALGPNDLAAQAENPPPLVPRGLIQHEPGVSPGYVLFGPIRSDTMYLVDNQGNVVHQWKTPYSGSGGYLLDNGHLLRSGRDPGALGFRAGGVNGIIQELAWDGTVVWEWKLSDATRVLHHDIEPLSNGNLLAIGWEVKTPEEALAVGRRADTIPEQGLHPEFVIEIEPVRPRGAKIVWEWHVWDHLVQDVDPALPNHGVPADQPGRLDINALAAAPTVSAEELEQLKALGYVPADAQLQDLEADFLHANAIDHHPELDQIVLTVPELGEIWILDHSTSTAQAAGRVGGRAGRGGDLLYRWGNPGTYGRGDGQPARLFFQHDARWIPAGGSGAGNLTLFNNGRDRPEGAWSSVEEITPPLGPDGRYALESGAAYGPASLAWSWKLPAGHFAPFISGAERLPNGNTMVCSGPQGAFLEIDREGRILWEYRNPYSGDVRLEDGSPPQPGIEDWPYAVFRATRIPPDHPGLAGRSLRPLDPQPPVHAP